MCSIPLNMFENFKALKNGKVVLKTDSRSGSGEDDDKICAKIRKMYYDEKNSIKRIDFIETNRV